MTHTMIKLGSAAILCAAVSSATATSTFQNYCSEIQFIFKDNKPTLSAVCRNDDNKFNTSTLTLDGIDNVNGTLTASEGTSSFQNSCGDIEIMVDGPYVTLTANCFNDGGEVISTSFPLENISSNNGQLKQP